MYKYIATEETESPLLRLKIKATAVKIGSTVLVVSPSGINRGSGFKSSEVFRKPGGTEVDANPLWV